MSTVALRGIVSFDEASQKWSWKGRWVFGDCVPVPAEASAAIASAGGSPALPLSTKSSSSKRSKKDPSQPFCYEWEQASHPSEVPVPSLNVRFPEEHGDGDHGDGNDEEAHGEDHTALIQEATPNTTATATATANDKESETNQDHSIPKTSTSEPPQPSLPSTAATATATSTATATATATGKGSRGRIISRGIRDRDTNEGFVSGETKTNRESKTDRIGRRECLGIPAARSGNLQDVSKGKNQSVGETKADDERRGRLVMVRRRQTIINNGFHAKENNI